jgi:uncharacterized protein (AIM24 family)
MKKEIFVRDKNIEFEVIQSIKTKDALFEVLQYPKLAGSSDVRAAEQLFYVGAAGMRLKLVRVTLRNGCLRNEPGTLYYMHGSDLEMKASTGGGVFKALKRRTMSGESFLVNEIHGSGQIYLEPSYGHFFLLELNNEEMIVDRSLFYAGSGDLDIGSKMVSASAAIAGGEGLFQTRIAGTGVAVLFSHVPAEEIQKITLNNETLSVDGSFAMMRTGGVKFTVKKSSRSWAATSVSGEGLLQTFSGTGSVWIAPTEEIYSQLSTPEGLGQLALPPGAMYDRETGK